MEEVCFPCSQGAPACLYGSMDAFCKGRHLETDTWSSRAVLRTFIITKPPHLWVGLARGQHRANTTACRLCRLGHMTVAHPYHVSADNQGGWASLSFLGRKQKSYVKFIKPWDTTGHKEKTKCSWSQHCSDDSRAPVVGMWAFCLPTVGAWGSRQARVTMCKHRACYVRNKCP